jgi:uncharacterized membrane protein
MHFHHNNLVTAMGWQWARQHMCGDYVQEVPGAWKITLVGLFGGLFGSLVDSVLGATLQFSGYSEERDKVVNYPGPGVHKISGRHILTNNQVNAVSASITAAATALLCVVLFA